MRAPMGALIAGYAIEMVSIRPVFRGCGGVRDIRPARVPRRASSANRRAVRAPTVSEGEIDNRGCLPRCTVHGSVSAAQRLGQVGWPFG
jgi:hypothetical protein